MRFRMLVPRYLARQISQPGKADLLDRLDSSRRSCHGFDLLYLAADLLSHTGQLIRCLEIHPKLRRRAEEPAETDCHVRADARLFERDIAYPLCCDANSPGQRISGKVQRFQEFVFQNVSRVCGPGGRAPSLKRHMSPL